jgi:hypothetical protein
MGLLEEDNFGQISPDFSLCETFEKYTSVSMAYASYFSRVSKKGKGFGIFRKRIKNEKVSQFTQGNTSVSLISLVKQV